MIPENPAKSFYFPHIPDYDSHASDDYETQFMDNTDAKQNEFGFMYTAKPNAPPVSGGQSYQNYDPKYNIFEDPEDFNADSGSDVSLI